MAASLVQTSSPGVGGYPSASTSFSSTPTVGNVVFVTGFWNPTFGTEPTGISISDNQGNTYSAVVRSAVTQENGVFIGYCVIGTASGTFTVTATVTGGSADAGVALCLQEWSGMDTASLLDQSGSGTQFVNSSFSVSASGANSGADRVVFAGVSGRGSDITPDNSPPDTGYTNVFARLTGGFGEPRGLASYKIVTASETSSADWGTISSGSGGSLAMVIATFAVASSGGTSHAATGALTGPGSTVAGSAQHNTPHPSSGALVGPGSTVVGNAARTRAHPSSGALTGPGSTVAGTAARTRQHAATGALTGPGAVVAGTAARTRQHPSSGVLVGPGSAIVGSADHQAAAGVHDSTGALVGQGSTVAGSAARFRAFAATGVLTGQGSAIAGSAARVAGPVSHAATGALVGPGSVVNGSAARANPAVSHNATGALVGPGSRVNGQAQVGDSIIDTHDGFWVREWKKMVEREKKLTVEEVMEIVEEAPKEVLDAIPEVKKQVKKEYGRVDYQRIANNLQMQRFIAEQILERHQQRMQEIEEDDLEVLLLL